MEMTFQEYINNPMGRDNAVFSNREMYRTLYKDKLDKILLREMGKVNYTLYNDNDSRYFVHMKVPSEVVPEFYYDTIIEFYTEDNNKKAARSIKDYNVKFYSNDPSFVYTFAHAFLTNRLFIKELVPRMSKEAIKKVAVQKNPHEQVGYVKSIYFTYLLMTKYSLFDKVDYETKGKKFSKSVILKEVEHADKKIEDRKIAGEKHAKKEKKEKKSTEQVRKQDMSRLNSDMVVKSVSRTNTVSRTKTAQSSVKYAKRAKKV